MPCVRAKKVPSKSAMPKNDNTEVSTYYFVDGMADVQTVHGDTFKTFNELGQSMLDTYMGAVNVADEVHLIYDRYDNAESVKSEERL